MYTIWIFLAGEDACGLLEVGLSVLARLLDGQGRAGLVPSGRITDHAGEIADDQDGVMAKVLELTELPENNGMTEVKVGSAGIAAELDPERFVCQERGLDLPGEVFFTDDLGGAPPYLIHLFIEGW